MIDRQVQKTQTYTGITGINTQDRAVQESMGAIADRTLERLGTTDRAIIHARRILLQGRQDRRRTAATRPASRRPTTTCAPSRRSCPRASTGSRR